MKEKSVPAETAALYARVSGRVQGVGFRYSTVREADRLRLNGWVRNAVNGDVEVWAEGPPESLEIFLRWLRRGSQFAWVDRVDAEKKSPKNYRGFSVEY